MGDWGETKNILLELEQLFSRENDINDVVDISKMAKEIEMHRESKLKTTKELIKGRYGFIMKIVIFMAPFFPCDYYISLSFV
jgi:hypothetical protein